MARGRAKWKKIFDLKPALGAGMAWIETKAPAFSAFLRYTSLHSPVADSAIIEDIRRPLHLQDAPYIKAYQSLQRQNVDGKNLTHQGDGVRLVTAICPSVTIHGHFMMPVDQKTHRLLALYEGRIPWGLTFPLPSPVPKRKLSGFVIALPPIKNYYHVLVDYLLPALSAIVRNPALFNKPITLVVNAPSPAAQFIVDLLRDAGFDAGLMRLSAFETVEAEYYLFAKSSAASTEHGYAFYPELKSLDAFIEARTNTIDVPEKIVIERTQTRLRNVLNQQEMLDWLLKKDFVPVSFNWNNLLFQIACFRRARQIVSVHGAALTNLCWGERGDMLEIFPDNARKTTYLHMASQNHFIYRSAFGSPEQNNQNFSVDLQQIEAALT